jgi:hypothetical protein
VDGAEKHDVGDYSHHSIEQPSTLLSVPLHWPTLAGSGNGDPNDLNWTRIARTRWVIASTTVACIAIHIAFTAQAVVATSMLAAIFSDSGRKTTTCSRFSILRPSNSGPVRSI